MHAACMHVAACRGCHAAHAADIDLWQDELQLPASCLEAAGPQTVSPLTHHCLQTVNPLTHRCLQTLADRATVWRQPRYGRYMRTRRLRRKAKRRAREADGAPTDDSVTTRHGRASTPRTSMPMCLQTGGTARMRSFRRGSGLNATGRVTCGSTGMPACSHCQQVPRLPRQCQLRCGAHQSGSACMPL